MGAKPVVTIDSPQNGEARSEPFTVSMTVTPPDGVGTAGALFLRNKVTGDLMATCVAPAGGGTTSALITGAIMALRSGTVSPRQLAALRRAGIVLPLANAAARRSSVATTPSSTTTAASRRASVAAPQGSGTARRSAAAQANAIGTARLSETVQPQKTATARRPGIATPNDATAPSVSTFTVGTPTGSSVPIIAFTGSDNVAVTGYLVTESSTPPSSGAAGWAGTAPSTYTAVGTGSVTLYPWAKDAAGNVSSVFGSPRTVTIAAATVLDFEDGTAQGMTLTGLAVSATSPIAGAYSLRWAGSITGSAFIPGSTSGLVASKSVTITNGATVSFKCRAVFSGGLSTCGFGLSIDGSSRANVAIGPGDSATKTVSWTSTLSTGTHALQVYAFPDGGNDGEGDVTDSFVLQVDDVTFA